jgi:hypothetical protein
MAERRVTLHAEVQVRKNNENLSNDCLVLIVKILR